MEDFAPRNSFESFHSAMSPRRRLHCLAVATVAFLSLGGCVSHSPSGGTADPDLALYRNVIDRVRESYVEPVTEDRLVTGSLKGMLTGLDPHSDYMTEGEYQEMLDDSQGEFAGIGAELTREDNRPKIISPIDDTPAARAGLKPGDVILRIDGRLTDGMSLKDVVDQLRGPVGSVVRVNIARSGERPFDVALTRAIIHVASVKYHLEAGKIGYLRVTTFAEKTQQEVLDALDQMSRQAGGRLNGLVLDLRNDPGGLLDEAVDVTGDFLDGGTVVSTHGRDADDDRVYRATLDGDRLHNAPMIVLINGASASASEIVAGALQDRHRAKIMGTRSFGKGSVQTIIPLDGRGALRLTTARYYTPSGRSIQDLGITPDERILPPQNQRSAQAEILHEADLRGALDNTGSLGGNPQTASRSRPASSDSEQADATVDPSVIGTPADYQLSVALKELREHSRHRDAARLQAPGSR
jgi:carboxyl-terminal processing protease